MELATNTTQKNTNDSKQAQASLFIEHQKQKLDDLSKQLCRRKQTLLREEEKLQQQYESLQKQCIHPKTSIVIEYEQCAYGGRTKTCTLCGWSNYSD